MRSLLSTIIFMTIFVLTVPALAYDSDIETHNSTAKAPSESAKIMIMTPLQQTIEATAEVGLIDISGPKVLDNFFHGPDILRL